METVGFFGMLNWVSTMIINSFLNCSELFRQSSWVWDSVQGRVTSKKSSAFCLR